MASLQCYKPDQTYYQGQYNPSLVDTETQYASRTETYYSESGLATQTPNPNHTLGYGKHNSLSHSHSHHSHGTGTGLGHGLTHTHGSTHGLTQTHSLGHTGSSNCAAAFGQNRTHKKRSEHKRGLFQKLKDGISRDDSSSSSSSDSENENEKRETRVFCNQKF